MTTSTIMVQPKNLNHNNGYGIEHMTKSRAPCKHLHVITNVEASDDEENDFMTDSLQMLNISEINKTNADKCAWLRSQIIGDDIEFDTPFGKRRLIYADHTASGWCLHHIENYIVQNATHTDDSFVGHRTSKIVHEAASYIKHCMGGSADDALLFCGSGTTAALKRLQEVMGIAIPSTMRLRVRQTLRAEERWVVFTGPYEHHSNLLSWRQSLAQVVEIPVDREGLMDMAMLRRALEDPEYANRPKVGSFSACSNVTGILADTRGVARLLHENGAFACFDFAATGPYTQIDMRSGEIEGYDAVFLSPHKFVGGPGTPGILLVSKNLYLLQNQPPSTCGGGTVCFVNGFSDKCRHMYRHRIGRLTFAIVQDTLYYEEIEEREDAGTPAILQKCKAALAFWVKEYMGRSLIESREDSFNERSMKRLLQNPNIYILGNTTAKRQPILSFLVYSRELETGNMDARQRLIPNGNGDMSMKGYFWRERATRRGKPLHGRFVTKLLNDLFGIQARGGCACAGPYGHTLLNVGKEQSLAFRAAIKKGYHGLKPGWTRLSFVYYMSEEEFEFILSAIEFVGEYGQRFLPLYNFNWKTGDWSIKKNAKKGRVNAFVLSTKLNPQVEVDEKVAAEHKYATYLEAAKQIAKALPQFVEDRRIPEEIDIDLLLFRV
eukprot:Gb_00368 [translate_table: standard]